MAAPMIELALSHAATLRVLPPSLAVEITLISSNGSTGLLRSANVTGAPALRYCRDTEKDCSLPAPVISSGTSGEVKSRVVASQV